MKTITMMALRVRRRRVTDRALVNAKGAHVSPCCRVVVPRELNCCPYCGKSLIKEPKK